MRRYIDYFKYVVHHKWYVLLEGLKLGVPIWILIFHDWDKFLPDEWFAYCRRYSGDGNYQDQIDNALNDPLYQMAWHLHTKRNKHHWQWWLTPKEDGTFRVLPMSDIYRKEMLADLRGQGRTLGKPDTAAWYKANRDNMQLHPETRQWIENQFELEMGEIRLREIGVL